MEHGWSATKAKVDGFTEQIGKVLEAQGEDVAFQLMDNNVYMGLPEEGNLILARMGQDGVYHVDGALVMASRDIQFNTFRAITPLLKAGGKRKMDFMTPIPRYFKHKCCSDPEHISNFVEAEYVKTLEESLFKSKKLARDFMFRMRLHGLRILGATKELRELGDRLCGNSDPVHLYEAGYNCLANLVRVNLEDMEVKRRVMGGPGGLTKQPRVWALGEDFNTL